MSEVRRAIALGLASLAALLALDLPALAQAPAVKPVDGIVCEARDFCRDARTRLPLRVLPRVRSNIYERADTASRIVESNVAAFAPLFVFQREGVSYADPVRPMGWFQVGSVKDRPLGFMHAVDVLEWRTAIVLSYTHPGQDDSKRRPVLMFKDRTSIENFVLSDGRLTERAGDLYRRLESGDVPSDLLISREPDTYVDIRKKFYVLPVLTAIPLDDQGFDEVRMLQFAAAAPDDRKKPEDQCTTLRKDFEKCSRETGTIRDDELKINVVYVMDFTGSMQVAMNAVLEGMANSTRSFRSVSSSSDRVRFGLVGYRDHLESDPKNEFVVKNFTPSLVDADQFVAIMKDNARAGGGGDLEEEVFAGMLTGINSRWDDGAIRILFLIGDASGHDPSHRYATTKHNSFTIRGESSSHQIQVASIYIKNPEQAVDWPKGLQQFREMAENPGSEPAFRAAEKDDKNAIVSAISEATAVMVERIRKLRAERPAAATATRTRPREEGPLKKAFDTGLVEFLGKATEPPRDISGWVLDKDLTNLARKAFDVHVLVTRTDLEQLARGLQSLLEAYETSESTNDSFFKSLQALTASAALDADVSRATSIGKTSLLPRWIDALPYKSQITSMKFADFEEQTPDKRQEMQSKLRNLLKLYRQILERPANWQKLNDQMAADEFVYPLLLDNMP